MARKGQHKRRNQPVSLEQILESQTLQAMFDELTRAGFPDYLLKDFLVAFANEDPRRPPMMAGTSDRALMGKMCKILEWAEEIERLNQDPGINPARRRMAFASLWKGPPLDVLFAELPNLLRFYSMHLWCAQGHYRATWVNGRRAMKLCLSTMARHYTGDPHFREFAELLSAALAAVGETKCVSADSLYELERDHRDEIERIIEELRKLKLLPPGTAQPAP